MQNACTFYFIHGFINHHTSSGWMNEWMVERDRDRVRESKDEDDPHRCCWLIQWPLF